VAGLENAKDSLKEVCSIVLCRVIMSEWVRIIAESKSSIQVGG
jgi:hypothetical protein